MLYFFEIGIFKGRAYCNATTASPMAGYGRGQSFFLKMAIVKSEAGKFNLRVSPMAVANTISVGHGSEKT